MTKMFCNVCGKEFDVYDVHNSDVSTISGYIGYGSKYDENYIELHMCNDCFDKMIDTLIDKCALPPFEKRGEE